MFSRANAFTGVGVGEGGIEKWDASSATSMHGMFYQAYEFNAPIQQWNVEAVTSLEGTFEFATKFDQPIGQWNIIKLVTAGSLNRVLDSKDSGLSSCNKRLIADAWTNNDVFKATNTTGADGTTMQPYTTVWAVGNEACPPLTDTTFKQATWDWMHQVPRVAAAKWGVIQGFDTSEVKSFAYAFANTRNEAGQGDQGDTSNPEGASFNADLGKWSTIAATDMRHMFYGSRAFNGDVSTFSTGKVEDYGFIQMFTGSIAFRGNVSEWDVSKAKSFDRLFSNTAFNGDLSKWSVGNVVTMNSMFQSNNVWNGNLNKWSTGKLTSVAHLFDGATAYEGNGLSYWDMSSIVKAINFDSAYDGRAFRGTALTDCNKRKIADMWSTGAFDR